MHKILLFLTRNSLGNCKGVYLILASFQPFKVFSAIVCKIEMVYKNLLKSSGIGSCKISNG